jgi:hypothetical protein
MSRTKSLKDKTRWACYIQGVVLTTAESYRDTRGASMEFKRMLCIPRMPHNIKYWRVK